MDVVRARPVIVCAAEGSMAFLKETERSLRAYFVVGGILGTLVGIASVSGLGDDRYQALPMLASLTIWFSAFSPLVIGPAFVIAGIGLKKALQSGAHGTKRLVEISAAVIVLQLVLLGAALTSVGRTDVTEQVGRSFGRVLIPLLLLWYIHASLRRLARESQRRIVESVADKFV
jgi:hypothetical protein